jgi:peptide deformylase
MKLIIEPNPKLRQISKKIKKFDKNLEKLALSMIETMRKENGVGLSAIQIGKPVKLSVIEFQKKKMDQQCIEEMRAYNEIPLTILVNPKITKYSKNSYIASEGCLSLPKIEIPIKRSAEVNVLAYDLQGNRIKIRARDFFARILQHEIDHTNGILITDRINEKN